MTEQENYMAQALALAREAAAAGEVPVGCVIVRGGEIVGRGRNRREEKQSTASHAEMEACIFELNALQSRYNYLLRLVKESGGIAASRIYSEGAVTWV